MRQLQLHVFDLQQLIGVSDLRLCNQKHLEFGHLPLPHQFLRRRGQFVLSELSEHLPYLHQS